MPPGTGTGSGNGSGTGTGTGAGTGGGGVSCVAYYPDIFIRDDDTTVAADERTAKNALYKRLYLAVRYLLINQYQLASKDAVAQVVPVDPKSFSVCPDPNEASAARFIRLTFLSAYGLLFSDNFTDPTMGRPSIGRPGPDDIPIDPGTGDVAATIKDDTFYIVPGFAAAMANSIREFKSSTTLFAKVLAELRRVGSTADDVGNVVRVTVQTRQIAGVTRRLVDERVDPNDPQLNMRIDNALALMLGDVITGNSAGIDISLPDLDQGTVVDIVADNVKALAAIYFASQLEEMKMFAVVDRVVEHFLSGMLPMSRGPGGQKIYDFFKEAPIRITEVERRNAYGRCFGLAQGAAADTLLNRDFSDLWIRFLSAVSIFNRQFNTVSTGNGGGLTPTIMVNTDVTRVTGEQAIKAARDLAVNLSLHGYASSHFIAVELQKLVGQVKELLSSADLLQAYGVRDMWQLIDRVSTVYLGGAVSSVRYKTMAQSGAQIMLFLASNAPQLSSVASFQPNTADIFKGAEIRSNVERWLAVTGTADDSIDKFSAPIDVQRAPTIPAMPAQQQLPDAVRNMLGQVGNLTNVGGINVALPGNAVPRA